MREYDAQESAYKARYDAGMKAAIGKKMLIVKRGTDAKKKSKPLTIEELLKKPPRIAWIEYKFSDKAEPKIVKGLRKHSGNGREIVFTDGDTMWLMAYGSAWRIWAETEPTRAEMENADWRAE